jgi:DNA-binding CsgD family transcriptional regulator
MNSTQPFERRPSLIVPSDEPMFVVTLEGVVTEWNASLAELLGREPRDAIGRFCWELIVGRSPGGTRICSEQCDALGHARESRAVDPVDVVVPLGPGSSTSPVRLRSLRLRHAVLVSEEPAPRAVVHLVEDIDRESRSVGERILDLVGERSEKMEVSLTSRENEVLGLLAAGLTDREVAVRLGIRHATARNHVRHILEKLGVSSRVAAVAKVLIAESTAGRSGRGRTRSR